MHLICLLFGNKRKILTRGKHLEVKLHFSRVVREDDVSLKNHKDSTALQKLTINGKQFWLSLTQFCQYDTEFLSF